MKKLSAGIHGILDYVTVLILLISPSVLNMQTFGENFTYALGSIHLVLTLCTNFKAGVFKIVPLKIHGLIEVIVAAALIVISIGFGFSGNTICFYYYLVFSVLLFMIWLLTDYHTVPGRKGGKILEFNFKGTA